MFAGESSHMYLHPDKTRWMKPFVWGAEASVHCCSVTLLSNAAVTMRVSRKTIAGAVSTSVMLEQGQGRGGALPGPYAKQPKVNVRAWLRVFNWKKNLKIGLQKQSAFRNCPKCLVATLVLSKAEGTEMMHPKKTSLCCLCLGLLFHLLYSRWPLEWQMDSFLVIICSCSVGLYSH